MEFSSMADRQNMGKHLVKWKAIFLRNVRGNYIDHRIPDMIDGGYEGALLGLILEMPKAAPISFEQAVVLFHRSWAKSVADLDVEKMTWFSDNFLEWISGQGYHIELTGDEFEPYFDVAML